MENFATCKVIGEETIQFPADDRCITNLQEVHHVTYSRYNLISHEVIHGEGFSFSSEGGLMKVSKEAHVKFRPNVSAMYICCKL